MVLQEVKELGKRCNFLVVVGVGTCIPEKVAMEVTAACECMLVEGICKCRWVEGAYGLVVDEMGFWLGVVIGRRRQGAMEMD